MRVQVLYGEYDQVTEPCRGYAYDDRGLGVRIGDIVTVPATWLSEIKGAGSGEQFATVCSLDSDYDGQVSSIIRVVETAVERKTRVRREKKIAAAYRRAAKELGDAHPEAVALLKDAAVRLGSGSR